MEILTNSSGSFIKTYPIMYNGKMHGMIHNKRTASSGEETVRWAYEMVRPLKLPWM